jgi:hypothetical protein
MSFNGKLRENRDDSFGNMISLRVENSHYKVLFIKVTQMLVIQVIFTKVTN